MQGQRTVSLVPARFARQKRRTSTKRRVDAGATLARISGMVDGGRILILLKSGDAPLIAKSTIEIVESDIGAEALIVFEDGRRTCPIIIGKIQTGHRSHPERTPIPLNLRIDGESLLVEADRELVLRCGKSSVTLTRAGKVIIRGAYLSSRSSGVNRINGGSVQIN